MKQLFSKIKHKLPKLKKLKHKLAFINNLTRWQKRLWLIAFLVGFNVVLGSYFLMEIRAQLPEPVANVFYQLGTTPREASSVQEIVKPKVEKPDLTAELLIQSLNDYREGQGLNPLKINPNLNQAAQELLSQVVASDSVTESIDNSQLEKAVKDSGYSYQLVSQNFLVGPVSVDGVMSAWLNNTAQEKWLNSNDFIDAGIATALVDFKKAGQTGVVLQLFGKPLPPKVKVSAKPQSVPPDAREIPDEEVIDALNSYRKAHGIYALNEDSRLCQYAEKRAQDLKIAGGLDGHAGFEKDFADQEHLPVGIRDYGGGRFAENLAHQYCRNMTTGESFVAETGVSLIEWCFDSSTKGHKEAQLSTESKNVCVRHADNMYVVIFGD